MRSVLQDERMAVEIVYETHAISEDNELGIATGWLPGRLSDAGREQALELGKRRRDGGFAVVFTSDLGRAVETAQIAFGDSATAIVQDPRLRECNYGDLNGMPRTRLDAERAHRIDEPFPGGESYRQVVGRMRDFLDHVRAEWNGQRVVVIGHAATRFALDHLVHGTRLEDLVDAPFEWQEGWSYVIESAGRGRRAMGDARAIVEAAYERLAQSDAEGFFALFADAAKVFVPGHTRISGDVSKSDAAPVVRELMALQKSGTLRRQVLDTVSDGANVFVVLHEYLDVSGEEIGYHAIHNWWIEDEKITYWWVYVHEYDQFERAWSR